MKGSNEIYTEAKLTKIAEEMLEDIDRDTVSWADTYDQSKRTNSMALLNSFINFVMELDGYCRRYGNEYASLIT